MASPLAFSTAGFNREVVRLSNGNLAERAYNARKGKWGWMLYVNGARSAFLTDKQFAKECAR
jgi:hypothetical protein